MVTRVFWVVPKMFLMAARVFWLVAWTLCVVMQ